MSCTASVPGRVTREPPPQQSQENAKIAKSAKSLWSSILCGLRGLCVLPSRRQSPACSLADAAIAEGVTELLQVGFANLRRLHWRVRRVCRSVELVHDVRVRVRGLDHLEDRFQIDLAFAERAVAGEMFPALVVL